MEDRRIRLKITIGYIKLKVGLRHRVNYRKIFFSGPRQEVVDREEIAVFPKGVSPSGACGSTNVHAPTRMEPVADLE